MRTVCIGVGDLGHSYHGHFLERGVVHPSRGTGHKYYRPCSSCKASFSFFVVGPVSVMAKTEYSKFKYRQGRAWIERTSVGTAI